MKIQCAKCKSMNPPSEEKCQTCGADLLPGLGRLRWISGFIFSILGMILFGYMGFSILKSPHPSGFLFMLIAIMMGFFAFSLFIVLKGPSKPVRYVSRAKRHLKIDPDQAYDDFTKAVRLQPSLLMAHQGRGLLFDQVNLSIEDLSKEIEFLTSTLKTSKSLKEKLREELAKQTIDLSNKRISSEGEIGMANESLRHLIQLLDFMWENIEDIHQFKTPVVGFGTGVTLHLRGKTRKNIQETRIELYRKGLVKATGYCRRCKEDVEPDLDFDCSKNKSHGKIDRVKLFVPDTPSNHAGGDSTRMPTAHE